MSSGHRNIRMNLIANELIINTDGRFKVLMMNEMTATHYLNIHAESRKTFLQKYVCLFFACFLLCWATTISATPEDDTRKGMEIFYQGDMVGAMQLYRKAAEQGYAPAQVKLAAILDRSEFNEEAQLWYQKAVEQNNAEAQFGLGMMHVKGEAPEPDMEKALSLITAAAEQGFYKAVEMMVQAYRQGELGLSINEEKAALWEEKLEKKITSESSQ